MFVKNISNEITAIKPVFKKQWLHMQKYFKIKKDIANKIEME